MKKILLFGVLLLAFSSTAHAISNLQLGISGGTYINETTVANSNVFDLYAYLLPNEKNALADTYLLSAALIKQGATSIGTSPLSLGSFKIGSDTYSVSADMLYGTPPVNALYPDIGSHDIFPTFYVETPFSFNAGSVFTPAINVADGTTKSDDMYREIFAIDLSGLAEGYGIHFDLYNLTETEKHKGTEYDVNEFAPFSHDAEGWKQPSHEVVPEPGTVTLLGLGVAGLAFYTRRRKRN